MQVKTNPVLKIDTSSDIRGHLINWYNASQGAFSENTDRGRRADLNVWLNWCAQRNVRNFPASELDVATFIKDINRAPATLRRYLSTLSTLHRAGKQLDPTKSEVVRLQLRKITRSKGLHQKQAAGITWLEIRLALDQLGDRLIDHRDRAMLMTMYDSLLRRSEVVNISTGDVERSGEDGVLWLERSKADQYAEGQYRFISNYTLELISNWKKRAGITDGLLFRGIYNGDRVSDKISSQSVYNALRRIGVKIGTEQTLSGHSCRVGAAQDMDHANIGLTAIMHAGGWKTERMPAIYTRRQNVRRSGMAKLSKLQDR